ncbi:hypothetical protein K435DRAFT_662608 [Dendrothele bispora CBS 962.96]|uniref:Uncharacterized protein n=1 Tax=Dendrothele bispora (strain CBS 962.96) TaxID=1314807 RepID=A0A4S8M5M2_DENBC|nr:hypothetical protein K435DRAFT_662608 [Dendrothele bispora CBS 962.96]
MPPQKKWLKQCAENLAGSIKTGLKRAVADAYLKGLNGRQAAWAARKYRGHRVLPESVMEDMRKAGLF